jgi:flagellar hook-associated protein 1 FlgK
MVRATFAGFSSALTALQANSKKLDVTSQNLANMNVEGYTRQELKTSSLNYENPTSFYMNENDVNVGFGVSMDEVRQLRDQFLDVQYRDQSAKTSYNDTVEYSLNSISAFMDESNRDGIRQAFDDVQKALTMMQDTSKVQDPVYQGQVQTSMAAVANLLNNSAQQIKLAENNEFEKISGAGSSENGAIENINQLLQDIGDLNNKIKSNQLLGNPALELQDERNLKIDELSKYIPIEVEEFSESYQVNEQTRYRIYNYDRDGRVVGRADWPSELRISMKYTAADGSPSSMILVNGTFQNADGKNYGSVSLAPATKPGATYGKWDSTVPGCEGPLDTRVVFTDAGTEPNGGSKIPEKLTTGNSEIKGIRFNGGSLQGSLDMLCRSTTEMPKSGTYLGYDYYMKQMDTLADTFATEMNRFNYMGVTGEKVKKVFATADEMQSYFINNKIMDPEERKNYKTIDQLKKVLEPDAAVDAGAASGSAKKSYLLLVNRGTQKATGITAENLAVSNKWVSGETKFGLKGNDSNETVLNMIQSMTQPHSEIADKSYADFMNNLSTRLANDQNNNKDALDTNNAVLNSIASSKDQVSGVSMDEEAANMMTYVSSYNAAARLMSSFDEMIQTLLGIAG